MSVPNHGVPAHRMSGFVRLPRGVPGVATFQFAIRASTPITAHHSYVMRACLASDRAHIARSPPLDLGPSRWHAVIEQEKVRKYDGSVSQAEHAGRPAGRANTELRSGAQTSFSIPQRSSQTT